MSSGASSPTGGVGGTAFGALSSIGSDLSVSVSFNIARELLDAAHDEQISEDELIGLVLGFAIILSALQARLASELAKRTRKAVSKAKSDLRERLERSTDDELRWIQAWKGNSEVLKKDSGNKGNDAEVALAKTLDEHVNEHKRLLIAEAGARAEAALSDKRSILHFLHLLVSLCQRIAVAIAVQLLAASVRGQQPSRLVRTVSLVALAAFFVFVEAMTHRVLV